VTENDSLDQPETYRIEIEGRLDEDWSDWFDGLIISTEDKEGIPTTTLTGAVVDQAALHGILNRIWNLSLKVISVIQIETDRAKKKEEV
jgi:hypothetical protein